MSCYYVRNSKDEISNVKMDKCIYDLQIMKRSISDLSSQIKKLNKEEEKIFCKHYKGRRTKLVLVKHLLRVNI